ncbi:MAG: sigma-70 family RNA polymerase sigma factor [Xanthomonadales bacterium]|nr:sigma-70 family RNA polymerase sigma factor [Xanthomonadales bacterium]
MSAITECLDAIRAGDLEAEARLYKQVYADLLKLAERHLRAQPAVAGSVSLVHETYLKLNADALRGIEDRAHLLAVASRAMRQILVDQARRRLAVKRGGGDQQVTLDDNMPLPETSAERWLAVHTALERLSAVDTRLAETVEWHYFGGVSVEEIAHLRGMSDRTVKRDLRRARAFLISELE